MRQAFCERCGFRGGKRIAAIISKREGENSCEGIFGQVFVNAPTDDILGNEVFEFPADLIQTMKIPECFPDDKGIKLAFFISRFFFAALNRPAFSAGLQPLHTVDGTGLKGDGIR